MDPLMGVDLGAGTHLEALPDKAINLLVKYRSLAVIYSTWLPEGWSLTCSGSLWLLYKYHTLTRGHFWCWFSKGETQTFSVWFVWLRPDILPCSEFEAATWESSTNEGFGGILGDQKEKYRIFSKATCVFSHLPITFARSLSQWLF